MCQNKLYSKSPHCCPVCGGKGTVPVGFYYNQAHGTGIPYAGTPYYTTNSMDQCTCRSCNGAGVLWG
jgi:hypothetical protein